MEDTSENHSYERYHLSSTERNTDDARYYIRSDMGVLNIFAFSYSQLVMERPDGEEIIIYDVNDTQLARTIIGLIVVVSFFTAAIVIITKQTIRLNEGPKQDE